MIFKTFDSNIDKISSKWGMFGRSFNDIGAAIVGRITDINKAFQATDDLVGSIKDSDSIWKRLYPSKESIKTQLIDIDAIYSQKTDSQFSSILTKLVKTNEAVTNGTTNWQNYFSGLKEGEKWQIEFVQNTDLQKVSLSDVKKAYESARASALAHNEAIKTQTLSAKAGSVALKALSIAGNMLAMWAITKGIELAVKGIDELTHSAEHCKERVDELMSSYQSALDKANSNAKTIENLASRYEELSKGVNNLGQNVSLATDEYSEYNDIVNQIADMFPTMVQGYTNEGNAILSLKGNVEQLRDAYKEAQQEAYNMLVISGEDSDGNDIIKNWDNLHDTNFFSKLFDLGADDVGGSISTQEAINQLKALSEMSAETYRNIKNSSTREEIATLNDIEKEIKYGSYLYKAFGLTGTVTDEEFESIKKEAKALIQTYQAEINSALKNVQTLANAYLMTNEDYAKLDDQSKNAASIIVNSINESIASGFESKEDVGTYVIGIVDTIKDNPEVQDALIGLFSLDMADMPVNEAKSLINTYIGYIAKEIGEDPLELKVRLGFDDAIDIAKRLQNSIHQITDDHGIADREEYATLSEYTKEFTQAQAELWLEVTLGAQDATEAIKMYEDAIAEAASNTSAPTLSISQTIDQLNTQLKPAFDSLKSAYQSIFTSDGYNPNAVDIPMLDSIKSSIEEINKLEDVDINIDMDAFDTLATTLTDVNTTEKQAKEAFNDFATSIFYASDSTKGMTDETKELVEQLLESLGIVNATEVAEYALMEAKTQAVLVTHDLADATADEYIAILAEGEAAGLTRQQIYNLTAAEIAFGNNTLNTEQKIGQLRNLAKAYGDTASAALATAIANDLASGHTDTDTAINDLMAQINAGVQRVDIDFSPIEKSAAKAGSSAGKAYTDALKDKLSDLNNVINYIGDTIGDQIDLFNDQKDAAVDALEAEKEAAEEALKSEKALVQEKIDAKQKEIDAIEEAAIARKNEIDLQKAQYDLERMQNQKTALVNYVPDTIVI